MKSVRVPENLKPSWWQLYRKGLFTIQKPLWPWCGPAQLLLLMLKPIKREDHFQDSRKRCLQDPPTSQSAFLLLNNPWELKHHVEIFASSPRSMCNGVSKGLVWILEQLHRPDLCFCGLFYLGQSVFFWNNPRVTGRGHSDNNKVFWFFFFFF